MNSSINKNTHTDKPEIIYYVEKGTEFVYECQVFDTYALARPATPEFYGMIRKIPRSDFNDWFEETLMSQQEIKDYMANSVTNFRIIR
jgi:hypothetical protein